MLQSEAAQPSERQEIGSRFKWEYIRNPAYDWVFFIAPFWVTIIYWAAIKIFPAYDMVAFFLVYILLQETHFGSTWMIYLDPQNREHYRTSKWVYYYVPALIVLGCIGLSCVFSFKAVLLVSAIFSAIHVTRQSTGVVGLYRSRAKDFDPVRRKWDNFSVYFGSAFFLGIGFIRFYLGPTGFLTTLNPTFSTLITIAAQITTFVMLLGALFCLFKVMGLELHNFRQGKSLSLSRLVVFTYSVLLYSPYIFSPRLEHAVAMGVGIHYVQYLGIVWWLNRNKYQKTTEGGFGLRVLGLVSQDLRARVPYLILYALIMFGIRQEGFTDWSTAGPKSWLYSIPLSLQLCHYHLEAFIWRFSNPHVRSTVLKYLKA